MYILDNMIVLEETGLLFSIEIEFLNQDVSVINFEIQN